MTTELKMILGSFVILSFTQVWAQQSTSTPSTSSAPMNQFREVIKQKEIADPLIITDKKLQADEGALSKYSLKFGLSYSGPGIGDLSNKNQPNPDGVVSTNQTKISGSIGARYRLDGTSTVSVGTGVAAIHPMHGWERTDVSSPYISYDKSSRYNDLQIRNIFGVSHITTPEFRKIGEYAGASYDLNLVHNIGTSKFAAGFDTKLDYYFYSRSYRRSDGRANQHVVSFFPNLKYQISDKLNVNSSLAVMFYNPRQLDDRWALWNRTLTQRLGMGYSYRRHIYFSPYVTVYPKNLKPANSTFNLAATFSVL